MFPDMNKKPEKPLMVKMAGYLEKKGRMRVVGVRRWKKRWCVLEGKLLLYFKTQLEYSHHLSPCRGSVNMGLVLSVTLRGPCQLQIVTRSQIIILRTKSKPEQDRWYVALRDACNNNVNNYVNNNINNGLQSLLVRRREHRNPCAAGAGGDKDYARAPRGRDGKCRASDGRDGKTSRTSAAAALIDGGRPRSLAESVDDAFLAAAKRNGQRRAADRRASAALRKCESDDRIRFYRQLHGLARVDDREQQHQQQQQPQPGCRSRSLSYESVYFKPQESHGAAAVEASRDASRSCRELGPAASASDGYEYVDAAEFLCFAPKAIVEVPQRSPRPDAVDDGRGDVGAAAAAFGRASSSSSATVAATDSGSDDREPSVDVVYVHSDRKTMAELLMEYGAERTAAVPVDPADEEPPPLPAKQKRRSPRERTTDDGATLERRSRTADGRSVYVRRDGAKEVIYDVPIPHGELIEHFRRLTMAPASPVKRYADNAVYDDSLEPSLHGTLHMAPDSLEIATMFPTYKRWSNDSGFNNYEEPNAFLPDQTHFEDSLEPVIAIMHHDRKIWQNVPNISSTDYFR